MGNTESSGATANIVTGLKKAQAEKGNPLYQLVDYEGGGELLQWMKYALGSGDYNIFDGYVEHKVTKFLYGGGKGKLVAVAELVKMRNNERNAMLGALRRKKGKGKSGPNILDNVDQDAQQGDMMKVLKRLEGGGKGGKGGSKYRELVWDISQRGAMGETLLHLCLLHGTSIHNEVARRLVETYPKLVNDIYLSEEYYGQSALHQAIVNEDSAMVRFLLHQGADVHQRCYGAFFCPDDQKATRNDSLEHEWVDVSSKTNYTGRTYWGEYPLSFAACTRQFDCFRLLRAKNAEPNMKDTNGNTVLHLMVIHEYPDMFDVAYRTGAKLHITNNQNLTPLTLAAKLGKNDMFDHVLAIERTVLWTYGDVVCSAYPLEYIDTVDQTTGELNNVSALSLIVYGETTEHLDLLDGLIEDVLEEKWKAFGKRKLRQQFAAFVLYFICFFTAFYFRPMRSSEYYEGKDAPGVCVVNTANDTGIVDDNFTISIMDYNFTTPKSRKPWCSWNCYLWVIENGETEFIQFLIRSVFEVFTITGALIYTVMSGVHMKRVGWRLFFRTLAAFPAKISFHLSFFVIILMIPFRLTCMIEVEDVLCVIAILTTSVHFLFFCRGVKMVGPFVLMFYKMVTGDVYRFFMIYVIFLMGFSQAFYIIFLGCHRGVDPDTIDKPAKQWAWSFKSPFECIVRLFMCSIGEFQTFFQVLPSCNLAPLGKVLFVIYELSVFIMLINMLIASMERTYEQIAETQKEWKRQSSQFGYQCMTGIPAFRNSWKVPAIGVLYIVQGTFSISTYIHWAKVILMLEQTLTPQDRLLALLKYSRPTGTDKTKRSFVVRTRLSEEEKRHQKKDRTSDRKLFLEEKRILYKRRLQGDMVGSSSNPIPTALQHLRPASRAM